MVFISLIPFLDLFQPQWHKPSSGGPLSSVSRLLPVVCRLVSGVCCCPSTIVENPLQIGPIMQNKPNFRKAKMNITSIVTKDYENQPLRRLPENKPNQTQSQNPIYPQRAKIKHDYLPLALFPLTPSTARGYNGIFSLMSCFQRTPNERG